MVNDSIPMEKEIISTGGGFGGIPETEVGLKGVISRE